MYSWEFWFATEVTGSGDVALGVSVAGQASETFAAAGAVATPSVTIAGDGAQTFAGAGAVATTRVAIAGTAHAGGVVPAIAWGGPGLIVTPQEPTPEERKRERERKRRQQREEQRVARAVAAAMTALKDQRQKREEEWLLGLASDDEYQQDMVTLRSI